MQPPLRVPPEPVVPVRPSRWPRATQAQGRGDPLPDAHGNEGGHAEEAFLLRGHGKCTYCVHAQPTTKVLLKAQKAKYQIS